MSGSRPTVLLIGQGPSAESALLSLMTRFDVVAVVRSHGGAATAVARRHGVRVIEDTTLAAVEAAVRRHVPDCVVVSTYDRVIPAAVLERSRFVNVHYAALPEYRGRAPVNWAIIHGRAETAMTVHVLTPELDAGPVLFQERVPLGAADTVTDVWAKLDDLQLLHLGEAVARHLAGDGGVPQDEAAASYGCTRIPADGAIDWCRPTEEVHALVRALTDPFPGAFSHLEPRRIVIWAATPAPSSRRWVGRVPGRVVARSDREGWVDVLTGDGVLRVETVQAEGDLRRPAADVITSVRATLGLDPAELLERVRALEEALSVAAQERPTRPAAARMPAHQLGG